MLFLQHNRLATATLLLGQLLLASCALPHQTSFQIIPGPQTYSLRFPDKHQTQFPNILRDYNGFEPGESWVDLRPSMEVRIENAYYQPGVSRRGLDGFLGTEIARYAVDPDGLLLESILPMQGRPPSDPPVQNLISPAVAHARYYRLYFEILFNKTTNSHGSVLLAADSADQLDNLSEQLTHPEQVCGTASTHCTAFPEACSVSIEMHLVVNGKNDSRDWGSLLTSVVGRHPRHLELRRLYAGRLTRVKVDVADQAALRLPLLPGDHIVWN